MTEVFDNDNLFLPQAFGDCLTYEQQIRWLKKAIDDLEVGEGTQGPPGPPGKDAVIPEFEATVSDTTGVPNVDVTQTEKMITLSFSGLKGERGEPGIGIQGEPGEQGPPGKDAVTPDFLATVDDVTGNPNVNVTQTDGKVTLAFSGLKGETGERGIAGVQGEPGEQGVPGPAGPAGQQGVPGVTPNISATGSVTKGTYTDDEGVVHDVWVEITRSGSDENPSFDYHFTINPPKGDTGPQGPAGPAGTIEGLTFTASVDNTTGTPGVVVHQEDDTGMVDFEFTGLKGETGPQGLPGERGLTPDFTAEVTNTTGTPTVDVTQTDTTVNLAFNGLKGEKGDTGERGITPTFTATVSNTTGTPSVDVTQTDTTVNLAFNGLKGEKGEPGEGSGGFLPGTDVVELVNGDTTNTGYGIDTTVIRQSFNGQFISVPILVQITLSGLFNWRYIWSTISIDIVAEYDTYTGSSIVVGFQNNGIPYVGVIPITLHGVTSGGKRIIKLGWGSAPINNYEFYSLVDNTKLLAQVGPLSTYNGVPVYRV